MLSLAIVAVASFDGEHFVRRDPHAASCYWELQPISELYELEALAVNGLDRGRLLEEGRPPAEVMREADQWVRSVAGDGRAVMVAYPAAFDWAFAHWYFSSFLGASPFGHGSCIDIRSLYIGVSGVTYEQSAKSRIPTELVPSLPHTHNALDDAIEQGELFNNLFELVLRRQLALSRS